MRTATAPCVGAVVLVGVLVGGGTVLVGVAVGTGTVLVAVLVGVLIAVFDGVDVADGGGPVGVEVKVAVTPGVSVSVAVGVFVADTTVGVSVLEFCWFFLRTYMY